jgi:hypothetical protein
MAQSPCAFEFGRRGRPNRHRFARKSFCLNVLFSIIGLEADTWIRFLAPTRPLRADANWMMPFGFDRPAISLQFATFHPVCAAETLRRYSTQNP